MINWPVNLVRDIARRRCVLFLGSGVSINSQNAEGRRPKTWSNFLLNALAGIRPNKHIKKLLNEGDYLTACELIKRALGQDDFSAVLREEFLTPRYMPAEIHQAIFDLDSRLVITPNFDKIYETYANSRADGSIIVKHHYDDDVISSIREQSRLIIKIHGSIDSPAQMIFSRAEYAMSRTRYRDFYELIQALSYTHTFIFIGCGVNDPDIRLLLEDSFFKHNSSRAHVMLLPKTALHQKVVDVIQETMNLKLIQYSDANNHEELLISLKSLGEMVESERDEISESQDW